jgi:hypothetical protein
VNKSRGDRVETAPAFAPFLMWCALAAVAPLLPGARWLGEHIPPWLAWLSVALLRLCFVPFFAFAWLGNRGLWRRVVTRHEGTLALAAFVLILIEVPLVTVILVHSIRGTAAGLLGAGLFALWFAIVLYGAHTARRRR